MPGVVALDSAGERKILCAEAIPRMTSTSNEIMVNTRLEECRKERSERDQKDSRV